MKNKMWGLALLLGSMATQAQSIPYSLAAISDPLKTNAAVVTHLEDINLDVESTEKATVSVHKIYTVVNEEGKEALLFNEYSSKYAFLDNVEILVFDKWGKQVGKYKKKDLSTVAVGEGLVQDGYVTYYRIQPTSYPVTIDVTYEHKLKSTMMIPDFRYMQAREAVVESHYTAKLPLNIALRYKAHHTEITPEVTEDGKFRTYKWSVKNIPPAEDEEGSVSARDRFAYVSLVTNQFSYYGYPGDMSTWKSFGSWINDLYKGLDELPTDRQQFFKQLVQDAPTEQEKIKRIYRYLQQNFRYVSIQLGIGGLQPFSATFTDQKKYGDCKALSNFMRAALQTVGIKSYVAIINASYNQEPVDPDFPANSFNHVILCVPHASDSTWLECTSSTADFGTLGTFTENRNALLITENGGVLVPTPRSAASANKMATYTTVRIEDDLSAITETKMTTKGAYREQVEEMLKEKKDEQKEDLVLHLGYKQPDVFEFAAEQTPETGSVILKMELHQLHEFSAGTKYFIKPRINRMWSSKLPSAEKRKLDFYFQFPFQKQDTTVFKLPVGCKLDVLPAAKVLQNEFALYQTKYWYNEAENAVYTTAHLELKSHKISAAGYKTVKAFFDEVLQDDSQRIVVIKSETARTEVKSF